MTFAATAETKANPRMPPTTLGSIPWNGVSEDESSSPTPGAGFRPDGFTAGNGFPT